MKNTIVQYWLCQVLGWGGWILINIFFVYLFAPEYYFTGQVGRLFATVLLIEFLWYILATHALRLVLKRISWLQFSFRRMIVLFVCGVAVTGFISYYGAKTTAVVTNNSLAQYEKFQALDNAKSMEKSQELSPGYYTRLGGTITDSTDYKKAKKIRNITGWYRDTKGEWKYTDPRSGRFWWDVIFNFILIALWMLIYMVWHYVLKNGRDQVERLQLEKTVKELEIKTIKSHINPHFIFNSLNSIRALVEENPTRARTAITELSNILRSSLQVEKLETVPLERELSIVKDYLALEQTRFEERLQVNFDIDEKTLQQPIPPMMLQTLVENAIKHGISKRINGGVINIISRFEGKQLELLVQNTGRIQNDAEGFGINSTRNRLQFLHNGNSVFSISNLNENLVQARITMPIA